MRELRAKLRNDELAKSDKSARAEKETDRAKHTNYKRNDDHIGRHRSEDGNELIAKACKVRLCWCTECYSNHKKQFGSVF